MGLEAVRLLFTKEYYMMFAGWLRPNRVLIAAAVVVAGVLACRDTTTPKEVSAGAVAFDPLSTAAAGFGSTSSDRGNLGTFHIQSKAAGYDVELKSHDNTDIVVTNIGVAPGGHSGWHFHPGPVLVVVKKGTITFYMGNDPTCSPQVHPAGTAFFEEGGMVGIARNESRTDSAKVVATFFVPKGSPTRVDAARPGNCAF
jgi:quercetin dioxygenase-like cupin family protein